MFTTWNTRFTRRRFKVISIFAGLVIRNAIFWTPHTQLDFFQITAGFHNLAHAVQPIISRAQIESKNVYTYWPSDEAKYVPDYLLNETG